MFLALLKRDIVFNKLSSAILCSFVMLAATLVAAAFCIIAEMSGASTVFYAEADPPHYFQMVTGDIDQQAIDAFSNANELVDEQQTLELLGIDNSHIYYADDLDPYADSIMEMSFVTQSTSFDYLLDEQNAVASVQPGQVLAPLYTIDAFGLAAGDQLTIRDGDFILILTVAGFLRDSQMNPSLVSSKRFLVCTEDYNLLKANTGEVEYMVEFKLLDQSRTGEFALEYLESGLPSGVAITLPMISLMNALSGGLSAVVLIFASLLLIAIALLCLRFTILASLEEEYREVGVMKAIGIAPRQISRLYKTKYYALGAASCLVGYGLSFAFASFFTASVRLYMGNAQVSWATFLLPAIGVLLVFLVIVAFCAVVFRRLRKVSAVEAIRGIDQRGRLRQGFLPLHHSRSIHPSLLLGIRDVLIRLPSYLTPIIVVLLSCFLIIVPLNTLNTIRSPQFVTYAGIGDCDALITLRYSADIDRRFQDALAVLADDPDVSVFAERVTANYQVLNPEGAYENLGIQNGDFSIFPLPYIAGRAPQSAQEIALSFLTADGYAKSVGDPIEIRVDADLVTLTVSGIYQDITNNGRSAQAMLPYQPEDVLWYTILLKFSEGVDQDAKLASFSDRFAPVKVNDVTSFTSQAMTSTINQFESVTRVVLIIAIAINALITGLFLKMLLAKDHRQIVIMKGLGLPNSSIRLQYLTSLVVCLIVSLGLGIVAANTLGESLVGLLLRNLGAARIEFVVDLVGGFILCPLLLSLAVLLTAVFSLGSIKRYENHGVFE
ncbi:MAG: ABC transporter permease [Coriobacteriales bacterium]|jgi:putative ABC transport system permease protein|nr:ABC transporter permease [Coriobacteriales bacterium]